MVEGIPCALHIQNARLQGNEMREVPSKAEAKRQADELRAAGYVVTIFKRTTDGGLAHA